MRTKLIRLHDCYEKLVHYRILWYAGIQRYMNRKWIRSVAQSPIATMKEGQLIPITHWTTCDPPAISLVDRRSKIVTHDELAMLEFDWTTWILGVRVLFVFFNWRGIPIPKYDEVLTFNIRQRSTFELCSKHKSDRVTPDKQRLPNLQQCRVILA